MLFSTNNRSIARAIVAQFMVVCLTFFDLSWTAGDKSFHSMILMFIACEMNELN